MESLAATTAVSLASTALDSVVGWAATAMNDRGALILGIRDDVESIRKDLEMMHSSLRQYAAAGGWSKPSPVQNTWVRHLRELADDIEDCHLDFTILRGIDLAARYRVAKRVRHLQRRVQDLHKRRAFAADHGRPQEQHEHEDDDEYLRHPVPALPDECRQGQIIGRDDDKKALVKLVLKEAKKKGASRVVWVWGMAGVGKSSLARMLYEDPDLVRPFECRAWVTVPHRLESPGEFGRLLEKQLGVDVDGRGGVPALLGKKRCLVVVDDVSSREEWELISRCLAANGASGRVIVTTRREDVVRRCAGEDDDVHELQPLPHKKARKLLCQKAYKNAKYKLSSDMVKQADIILQQCQGCPLAIVAIGGLLARSSNINREWMNLQEHLGSGLPSEIDIMRVISLTYDRLPYHVKSCLLYMSVFPRNYGIRRARLWRRWMAEGYIKIQHGMTVEEIACSLYNELIKRNMIQPSDTAMASMSSERYCVHGLVLDVILSKYIDEKQIFIMDRHCRKAPQSNVRHLVVTTWKRHEKIMAGINLRLVRSLTIIGECPMSLVTPKMRMLRVLDLEDTIDLENNDLRYIGQLPHLRYLGLRGTHISRLPSLEKLRCLETLDVRDTKVTHLPAGIVNMEKLCYLRGGVSFDEDLAKKIRENKNACRCSNNFMDTVANLLCVRGGGCNGWYESPCPCYPSQFSVRAPEEIEKLKNMQVLGLVHIAEDSETARKLGTLSNLHRLGVDFEGGNKAGRELCNSIDRLVRLERLEVRFESLVFLEHMKESSREHLRSVRLSGRLGHVPGWMSSLNNLAKLKLLQTQLRQVDIEVIGKLANITLLGLWEESFVEESICFSKGTFQKLKVLYIQGLEKVNMIQINNGALPTLEKLRVGKCINLYDGKKGLSGVESLWKRNLTELIVTSCGTTGEGTSNGD